MRVAVTGAGGFVGRRVRRYLLGAGARVVPFTREPSRIGRLEGEEEPREFSLEREPDFSGCEVVVHLAGENVFGVWTRSKRERIHRTRVEGTRRVVEGMRRSPSAVTLLCASATGYYGDRGEEELTEEKPSGEGFLAEVCRGWEAEALRAKEIGVRVCCVRMGMVVGRDGGAFPLIARVFRMGLGGRLGSGEQWMPAVHVEDVVRIFLYLATSGSMEGVYNASVPVPFRNREFTVELGRAVWRPVMFPVPGWVLRGVLGGLSELVLASQRVIPARLVGSGFEFGYRDVAGLVAGGVGLG